MAAKMKLSSAIFKLNSSKRFCEDICWLFLGRNEFDFDGVVFDLLASEMVVNLKMFGFFVKDWVVAKFDVALVITVDILVGLSSRILSSSNNLRIQTTSKEHWARALYSDSQEDLKVLDCFLEFQ